ncbi:YjbH domain-containing protein [Actibacterium lipolyticum]|uniref:YjbH domain-containing protein n=1 Tax=Actibacterium lipolyticum TaxID=1524263 RepID=A0A238KPF6_9RHOB|nr:YjbH domain-containing protein [Actibacterium lipolyticum]SMX44744.1 hypothetical protein COL8621_02622 [Actibacterium lipolyticum]
MKKTTLNLCAPLAGALVALSPAGALADNAGKPKLSFYGAPGLVEMPTAESMPDGQLAVTLTHFGGTTRNTLSFQITDRLSGSFRYAHLDGFRSFNETELYDRSFDIAYRLVDEGRIRPSIAVGLRDFAGTGVYGSEYVVATKSVHPRLKVTGGIGWGRLGSYNGFTNPLGAIAETLETRPGNRGIEDTGQVSFEQYFRGDAAFFGGVEWQYSDRLSLFVEYSSDDYVRETQVNSMFVKSSPLNFGLKYSFKNGLDLGGYYLYGEEIGAVISYSLNPKQPPMPGGRESAPPVIYPRNGSVAAASWSQEWVTQPDQVAQTRKNVAAGLDQQGVELEALVLTGDSATLRIRNQTYDAAPQAIGRTARSLTQTLPASVETITIIPVVEGMRISAVTLKRSDLEELETQVDGSWQSYIRADIADASAFKFKRSDLAAGAYPDFSYKFGAYLSPSFFDPDQPIRADVGAELNLSYTPAPGLVFSTKLRQKLAGNLGDSARVSDSVLPHVRSDAALYEQDSDFEISNLTAEYFFRPTKDVFGRVTVGYLERMFGGVSGELLWKPVSSRLALGAELNYARQRDFDIGFGFQDYDVVTGHASAYYNFGNGFLGQVDAGRYLAGDYGATFTLDREFANGWRIGAFFTLTDVSFEEFGEGSFDKGIRLYAPVSWVTGEPSQKGFGTTIRPLTRDGGARLDVRNRLYEVTRGFQDPILSDRWGKFWR